MYPHIDPSVFPFCKAPGAVISTEAEGGDSLFTYAAISREVNSAIGVIPSAARNPRISLEPALLTQPANLPLPGGLCEWTLRLVEEMERWSAGLAKYGDSSTSLRSARNDTSRAIWNDFKCGYDLENFLREEKIPVLQLLV